MVTRGMPSFWTTFNPSDFQYLNILWLAGIAVGCSESTISTFCHATTIINLVTVANFFHKTCRGIFNYLLKAEPSNGSLFGSVLAYFGTVETNGQSVLHLHYIVLLKGRYNFSNLCIKIADKDRFKTQLFAFLDQVIRCKLILVDTNKVSTEVGLAVLATKDGSVFIF